MHPHFEDEQDAGRALTKAGFSQATLHAADRHPAAGDAARDPAAKRIRIIEASA